MACGYFLENVNNLTVGKLEEFKKKITGSF